MPAVFWTARPCSVCGWTYFKDAEVRMGGRLLYPRTCQVCQRCGAEAPKDQPGQWPFNDERARLVELASTLRAAAPEAASLLDVAFHLLTTSTQQASDRSQSESGAPAAPGYWGSVVLRSPGLAAEVRGEGGEVKAVTRLWRDGKLVFTDWSADASPDPERS